MTSGSTPSGPHRHQGAELVTAQPVGPPAGNRRGQSRAEPGQQGVAGRVAEAVVVALEAVEVEHDQAEGVLGGRGRGAGEVGPQLAPVPEAGEAVGAGLVTQLLVRGLPLAPAARRLHEQQRDQHGQGHPAGEDPGELRPAGIALREAHAHRQEAPSHPDRLTGRGRPQASGPVDRMTRVRDLEVGALRKEPDDRRGELTVEPGAADVAAQGRPPLRDGVHRRARSVHGQQRAPCPGWRGRAQLDRGLSASSPRSRAISTAAGLTTAAMLSRPRALVPSGDSGAR